MQNNSIYGGVMTVRNHVEETEMVIAIEGEFTFELYDSYTQALDAIKQDHIEQVVIDLGEVSFIDSSAMGLLLVTREECDEHGKALILSNPRGRVKDMIDVSNFRDLFTIRDNT